MVQIDTRLPLMVQSPDIVNALATGTRAAADQANVLRAAEGQNVFRQHGAGALTGDKNALAAIAGYDPTISQGIQANSLNMDATRLDMDATRQRMGFAAEEMQMLRAKTAQAIREAEDKADAESQVRMMERAFRAADMGMRTGDMAAVRQGLSMFGFEDLDPEEGMQAAAQILTGGIEGLAGNYLPKPDEGPLSPAGKLAADLAAGRITQEQFNAASEKTPLVDMSGANFGQQGPGVTDKFYERLDTGSAEMFMGLLNNGMTVPARIAQLDEMQSLLSSAPAGATASLQTFAGNMGIPTDGLSELQAAQAIINRLVPSQRPPGSGPMSDADLELFKQSLPRLINTREGNAQIISTLRRIAEYEAKQAEIAERVATRQITPADGMRELRTLENPLGPQRRTPTTTPPPATTPPPSSGTGQDFSGMTSEELATVDVDSLSLEEIEAFTKRLDEIAAGRTR